MEYSVLLVILSLQTVAVLAIAVILFTTARRVKRVSTKLNMMLDSYEPKLDEILESAEGFIRSCEQVGEQMVELSAGLRDIAEKAKETADDVADVVQDTTLRAERQVDHVDQLVSDAVDKAQDASEYVTRTVLPQFVEIAAMIRGIYVTINYLRGKRTIPFSE